LKTLQHKGNLVLKLSESITNFTASILFILYQFFDSIILGKPFASSPLSSTQYLVCQGHQKASGELVKKLESLYEELCGNPEQFDFLKITLIDPRHLDNEEKFRQYLSRVNDMTVLYRHSVIV